MGLGLPPERILASASVCLVAVCWLYQSTWLFVFAGTPTRGLEWSRDLQGGFRTHSQGLDFERCAPE